MPKIEVEYLFAEGCAVLLSNLQMDMVGGARELMSCHALALDHSHPPAPCPRPIIASKIKLAQLPINVGSSPDFTSTLHDGSCLVHGQGPWRSAFGAQGQGNS